MTLISIMRANPYVEDISWFNSKSPTQRGYGVWSSGETGEWDIENFAWWQDV